MMFIRVKRAARAETGTERERAPTAYPDDGC